MTDSMSLRSVCNVKPVRATSEGNLVEQLPERPERESELGRAPAKKPYQKPILQCLGSLREMTTAVSNQGALDGARTGNKRRTGRGGHHLLDDESAS